MFKEILVLFVFFTVGKLLPKAGPYDVIFRGLITCNSPKDDIKMGTKFSRINRTTLSYSSNITLPHGLNDDMQMVIDFSVWGNGGWRPHLFILNLKACSELKKFFPGVVEDFFEAAGHNAPCPLPPGTYGVKNYIFKPRFAAKRVHYGSYKLAAKLIDSNVTVYCFSIIVDAVPKQLKLKHK